MIEQVNKTTKLQYQRDNHIYKKHLKQRNCIKKNCWRNKQKKQ